MLMPWPWARMPAVAAFDILEAITVGGVRQLVPGVAHLPLEMLARG